MTIDYIDENLQPGDTYMIASLGYEFAQMANAGDFQISRQIARARRQHLTLYRALGNSTTSKRWIKRIYPEVRLAGPPSESTGTGQNSLNQRVFTFRVERIQHPDFQGDFYLEQFLDFG